MLSTFHGEVLLSSIVLKTMSKFSKILRDGIIIQGMCWTILKCMVLQPTNLRKYSSSLAASILPNAPPAVLNRTDNQKIAGGARLLIFCLQPFCTSTSSAKYNSLFNKKKHQTLQNHRHHRPNRKQVEKPD